MWVGMAGPAANFILAVAGALVFRALEVLISGPSVLLELTVMFIFINLILGLFNLIPIPPLDGSRILTGLLPRRLAVEYLKVERYGFLILVFLLYIGVFRNFIFPAAIHLMELMVS